MNRTCVIIGLAVLCFCSTGCGPNQAKLDEAYNAGWRSIYNERCQGIEQPLMMPSQYDDSKGSGKLVAAYRAGIADAEADPNLCK